VRLRRPDPHTLAGAYALDALTHPDRAAFERHLAGCEACRQEADGLRAAAARLGQAAAAPPPAGLREQVLAMAARTRQLPPPARQSAGRALAWPVAPRLAVAVAGICLLVALGIGTLVIHTQHRLTEEQARSARIAAVLNAPDATMMSVHGSHGGRATVVMSHAQRALILTTARLPGLPSSKRYEVWLMPPGSAARPAGMLPAPHQGMTAPVLVTGLAAGDRLGVTVEPAGGAHRPSAAPVLMFDLPS
jgi:anti-sigma-K factor RskA